ncbi:hypothetical protein M407DRAFT_240818 [Tulasnella calospora MUT 4182]|uniref:Uncharacterized protein n=1 Tax=Tulasnella calospora MUT 4182 TaxID=1051891 RepID=A0A0C3LIU8_9AGAM|nr:hypothetical protein M407DRAFT_240818 [Tulasnella calospora MUT 4182]
MIATVSLHSFPCIPSFIVFTYLQSGPVHQVMNNIANIICQAESLATTHDPQPAEACWSTKANQLCSK